MTYAHVRRYFTLTRKSLWVMKGGMGRTGVLSSDAAGVCEDRAGAAVVLTLRWDQRFESSFPQQRVTNEPHADVLSTADVRSGSGSRLSELDPENETGG